MRADEIMTAPVVTVRPDATVHQAALLMNEHAVTSLPVLDDDGNVVGIVSEVDLIRDRMPHDPRSHLRPESVASSEPGQFVDQVMSTTVVCLSGSADTADLAEVMLESNVRAVPIVEGGRLIGIVSRRDLLRTLLRDDTAIRSDVVHRLDDYAGEPGRWKVTVENGVVTVHGQFDDEAQREIVNVLARTVPGVTRVHTAHH